MYGEFQLHVENLHQFAMPKDPDHLHLLVSATWRVGVFVSESDGHINIWLVALID